MKIRFCILVLAIVVAALSGKAFAQDLKIFAWLENDTILVQCDFDRGRPAPDASITVYDSVDRRELAHGVTNRQGRYAFPVPEVIRRGHGLLIIADAGKGHRGGWAMDASELYAAASLTAGFDEAALAARGQAPGHVSLQTTPVDAPAAQGPLTREHVRDIVNEALELKLAPIRQQMAASSSWTLLAEIIGGLGWIVGLIGIVCYFRARKS